MDSTSKARALIGKAYVELRSSNDQKSSKACNELSKAVKTLSEKPAVMAG